MTANRPCCKGVRASVTVQNEDLITTQWKRIINESIKMYGYEILPE